jgi:hypothetical protein
MALTDTSARHILAGYFPQRITLAASQTVLPGDPLGYSTGWKLADGNSSPAIPAQCVAGEAGVGADIITVYRTALVEGFTGCVAGAKVYLSDTAGKYAASPSGTTPQTLGESVNATTAWIDCRWVLTGLTTAEIDAAAAIKTSQLATNAKKRFLRSPSYHLDSIGAATFDDVLFRPSVACTLVAARIVYDVETAGTIAAGSVAIGSTVGGAGICAAVNFENSKTVGTTTALVVTSGVLAATTMIALRVTGVAATAAGWVHVELEYTIDD